MDKKARGDLAVQTWDALKGASWPIFLAIGERTRAAGLTPAQTNLLFILFNAKEPMTPLAVARVLDLTPGTISGALDPLEERGLIERSRGEHADKRVVLLRLTIHGREVMRKWLASCRALIEERTSALTDAECRELIALLAKIAPANAGVPEKLAEEMTQKRKGKARPSRAR